MCKKNQPLHLYSGSLWSRACKNNADPSFVLCLVWNISLPAVKDICQNSNTMWAKLLSSCSPMTWPSQNLSTHLHTHTYKRSSSLDSPDFCFCFVFYFSSIAGFSPCCNFWSFCVYVSDQCVCVFVFVCAPQSLISWQHWVFSIVL